MSSTSEHLIERLAREAGFEVAGGGVWVGEATIETALARFAALVANECAAQADAQHVFHAKYGGECSAASIAAAIRAKFKEPG